MLELFLNRKFSHLQAAARPFLCKSHADHLSFLWFTQRFFRARKSATFLALVRRYLFELLNVPLLAFLFPGQFA